MIALALVLVGTLVTVLAIDAIFLRRRVSVLEARQDFDRLAMKTICSEIGRLDAGKANHRKRKPKETP